MKFNLSAIILTSYGILVVSGNVIPLEGEFNKRDSGEVDKLQAQGWLDDLLKKGKDFFNEAKDAIKSGGGPTTTNDPTNLVVIVKTLTVYLGMDIGALEEEVEDIDVLNDYTVVCTKVIEELNHSVVVEVVLNVDIEVVSQILVVLDTTDTENNGIGMMNSITSLSPQ
ncbi:hypothetical protein BB560_006919 [Smittium megazygosporum]|uniref:Uncharacterized protein n=1 Tax=Smittium megazygosporum TaxID=133381 RepID=A0A2T9Y097_9FUNG|nr:hypothetical protein BB560_006919 [Smittium megazygosporum]